MSTNVPRQTLDCTYRDAGLLDRLPGDLVTAQMLAEGIDLAGDNEWLSHLPRPFLAAFPNVSDEDAKAEYERRRAAGIRVDPRTETRTLSAVLWWLRSDQREWTLREVHVHDGNRATLGFDCAEELAYFGVIRQVLRAYGVEILD